MRILKINAQEEAKSLMQKIGVDPYGIKIMLPKAVSYAVLLNDISSISANILKQEMLSLGGDAAVARGVLTGKLKRSNCLVFGTLSQLGRLAEKLKAQPFGLKVQAALLQGSINCYQNDRSTMKLGPFKLGLGKRTRIMAIMNLTPDSFSGDGLYRLLAKKDLPAILGIAQKLVAEGADILDIGGESTRPGAIFVSAREEINRVKPVIKLLAKKIKVPISIDTYKPEVAQVAFDEGALLVNDISGLRCAKMRRLASAAKVAVVIVHMRGASPKVMQKNIHYRSLLDQVISGLSMAVRKAEEDGVDPKKIIIDPGIGFGKLAEHNLEMLNHLDEFKILGKPVMVGVSRKAFIRKITGNAPAELISGTLAASVLAVVKGAQIVRVHDLKAVRDGLKVADAIMRKNQYA
jgi:dihydropteroate synthase